MTKNKNREQARKIFWPVKLLALACACLSMIFGVGMQARASGEIIFHVENQKGKAGDVVTVPVELTSNEEVGGFEIIVYYDSETMTFEKLKKGSLIEENDSSLFDYYHNEEKSSVKIVYVVADTVKAKGTIVNIDFKLKKDCGETLPIGMGVTQLVDNSETGEDIVNEADVTGVDTEYQKQLEPQIASDGGNAGSSYLTEPESNGQSDDRESSDKDEKSTDTSTDKSKDEKSEDGKDETTDIGGEDASATKKDQAEAPVSASIVVVVVIAVLIGVAVVIVLIKKRKNK